MNRWDDSSPDSGEVIRFGSFSLDPSARVLLDDGKPVRLGHRALDILLILLARPGEFVANDEIYKQVWPRTIVADGNLRVHIAGLRKVLGDGRDRRRYIVNVPNRGYSFVAALQRRRPETADPPSLAARRLSGNGPPAPLGRVIGQDAAILALGEQIAQRRLVTLVGPGGIGKTTVALAAVAAAAALDPGSLRWSGMHFVDLGSVADPAMVPASLASALGLGALMGDALGGLLTFLHDKSLLIVFDNCEHLVGAVADLVEGILRGAPGVHVLATSREPLRAEGEWVQRLQPLALPPAHAELDAAQVQQYAAVELFVERCSASLDTFRLADADSGLVADICRRLDGIPLAIELAAARIHPLGLRGLAVALDNRLALLSKGRRTAVPRHQTLRATLDWSFELLPAAEQQVLLHLSVFAGAFTLEAATALAAGDQGASALMEAVSELVAKSLLGADVSGDDVSFRLLDTTRSYALDRLAQQAETLTALQRRHARLCLATIERAQADWAWMPTQAFVAKYRGSIDDVRAALHWSLGPGDDAVLGITLTVRSAPFFFQLSSTDEHLRYVERALAVARPGIDARLEFELSVVSGHAIFNSQGFPPDRQTAFDRAGELAEQIGDPGLLAIARATQWMSAYQSSHPQAMLGHARDFLSLTAQTTDPALALHRDRIMAPTFHLLGDQRAADACCERGLADPTVIRAPFLTGTRVDRHVSMSCIHVRVLWLLGRADQAEQLMLKNLAAAEQQGEPVALVHALAFSACPLALWCGRTELARARVDRLQRYAAERALTAWRVYGEAFEPFIAWLESDSPGQPPAVLNPASAFPQLSQLMATLHAAYATPAVLAYAEAGQSGWCLPELLRARGEQAWALDPAAAERLLSRALELALHAGAVPWALRSATTLAGWRRAQGQGAAAAELLDRVLALVTEGFDTRDVRAARAARAMG